MYVRHEGQRSGLLSTSLNQCGTLGNLATVVVYTEKMLFTVSSAWHCKQKVMAITVVKEIPHGHGVCKF